MSLAVLPVSRPWKTLAVATVLFAAPATAALAQSSPFAVGANLGTPGIGAELQVQVSSSLVLRGDADWLSYSRGESWSGVDYDGKLKSTTAGLFADWHPGATGLLVSGGAYFGDRKVDLSATPSGSVVVGGQSFTPAQVGRINGSAKLSKVQPFAGVGWDNTFMGDGAWGFRALAGVAFSSDPEVSLTSSGGVLSSDPTLQARLRQEESEVRDDAKNWKYFPVVQIGVTRRF